MGDDDRRWNTARPPPVKVGDTVTIKILGVGSKGDLFGKQSGFIIFVRDAVSSDIDKTLTLEITEVREKFAFSRKI
jgi:predicted RNA-binding protein with TRAM domain